MNIPKPDAQDLLLKAKRRIRSLESELVLVRAQLQMAEALLNTARGYATAPVTGFVKSEAPDPAVPLTPGQLGWSGSFRLPKKL